MRILFKLLKALNSEVSPWQIAVGIMLGMIIGVTPLLRLHNLIILFIALFFRINFAAFLASIALFSGLAWFFDPLMELLGETLLTAPALESLWTALYNTNLGYLSQFYHTMTLGSLLVGLLLAPLVLLGSRFLIVQYRTRIMRWVARLKVVRVLKASRFFRLYADWRG